jgi:hypothetical protein
MRPKTERTPITIQVKQRGRENPAAPTNVKTSKINLSESSVFFEQTRANKKATDGKEQAHTVRSGVSKTHELWITLQPRVFDGMIEEHGNDCDRAPTI